MGQVNPGSTGIERKFCSLLYFLIASNKSITKFKVSYPSIMNIYLRIGKSGDAAEPSFGTIFDSCIGFSDITSNYWLTL